MTRRVAVQFGWPSYSALAKSVIFPLRQRARGEPGGLLSLWVNGGNGSLKLDEEDGVRSRYLLADK